MTVGRRRLVARCSSSWRGRSLTISATGHMYVLFMPRGNAIVARIVHTGTITFPFPACMIEPPPSACIDTRCPRRTSCRSRTSRTGILDKMILSHAKSWLGMPNSRVSNHQRTSLWYVLRAGSQLSMTYMHPDVAIPILFTCVCNGGYRPRTRDQVATWC